MTWKWGAISSGHCRYLLVLAPEDVKDRKAREYEVPRGLEAAMQSYLERHRPVLLRGAQCDALWITRDGRPFSAPGFAGQLAKLTKRHFGEALRPYDFRHVAATSVALDDPEHVQIIASILGHSTLATSEKYYNRASGIEATRLLQDLIRQERKATVSPLRPTRLIRS